MKLKKHSEMWWAIMDKNGFVAMGKKWNEAWKNAHLVGHGDYFRWLQKVRITEIKATPKPGGEV